MHNSKIAGHIGIVRTDFEFRKRFYFPGFTEYLINAVKNCLTCIQTKLISNKALKTFLQPLSSLQSFPVDMLQIDLVGSLRGTIYKYALTGIDVFSKYLFAVPLTNVSAQRVAQGLTSIFFQHSYIPHTILSDLGSIFLSVLMHELAQLLEVKLKHATLKHAQSVGVVERAHGALKRILKLNTNEQWSNWHKYVPLATYIHNTSYYSSIGCTPTSIFHGREPIKPLDVRFNNKNLKNLDPKSDFVIQLQDAMKQKFSENKSKLIHVYHKYQTYYDEKAPSSPLALNSFCLLLNPKLMNQSDFGYKSMTVWLPLYRIERVLTNSNYLIRKVGTLFTQSVHRIRLRPYTTNVKPSDLDDIDPNKFVPDPLLGKNRQEPELFDEQIPKLIEHHFIDDVPQENQEDQTEQQPAKVTLSFPIAAAGALPAPAVAPIVPHVPAQPFQPAEDAGDLQGEQMANIPIEENDEVVDNFAELPFFPEVNNESETEQFEQFNGQNADREPQQTTTEPANTQEEAQSDEYEQIETPISIKRETGRNLFEDNERQSKTQPRKVQFKKGTRSPPPANKDHPHMVRTIDGKMLIPHPHLKKSEKQSNIKQSYRKNMERLIKNPNAAETRATKLDVKRSTEVKNQQLGETDTPGTSTSYKCCQKLPNMYTDKTHFQ